MRQLEASDSLLGFTDSIGFFFDGTGNDTDDSDRTPTHVAALYEKYGGDAYYSHGVGTRSQEIRGNLFGRGADARLDKAMEQFKDAYSEAGGNANIHIFGFSRGAAMAREFGHRIQDEFPEARIQFLGIFDTVAQMGAPDRYNINTLRLDIPDNVEYVAHAIAADERRKLFPLTSVADAYGRGVFWTTVLGPKKYNKKNTLEHKGSRYHEKPFAGAHSDIGGGYSDGTNLKALVLMCDKAREHGVPLDTDKIPGMKVSGHTFTQGSGHDSRYPGMDRIPWTGIGRWKRVIFPGNLEPTTE